MVTQSDFPHESAQPGEVLDEALEQIILALESDEPLDRHALLEQYPQWANELNQFIDNWMSMEQKTAALVESSKPEAIFESENLNGKMFCDYELLELISSGGMGVVYRARQVSLGRIVALKMVLNAVRDKTRFRIEAEAVASLHHANIVSIHEVGEFEGQPFLSMQYIAGGTLHDHLKPGPMAPKAAAVLVRTIANAVHYAHQRGILHRDLKPANVLLDSEHRPFVTDFGLAKQIGNSLELTRSGAIIGTPGYMAPEQAMGQVKSITIQADVYGLGAILYATLTGNAPFKSDSELLTLRKVIEEPPVSPRAHRPELDRNLETICLKCLEKSPALRYGSARQLADDLSRFLQGEPVSARPVGMLERRWRWCARNPAMAITAFFAGLMLTALVMISLGFAWREYVAKMNSEFASIREAAMTEAVKLAHVDAASKNQKAQQAVAELYTTNGLWAARTDLHGESLLWFARAAALEGIGPTAISDSRSRCLSWLSESPKPLAAFQLPAPIHTTTFQDDWRCWHLSETLSEVMFKSGDDFGIWNFDTDEIWRPIGRGLPVSSAAWSNDGKLLAIGSSSGELRLVDAATKATVRTVFFDAEITSICFSTSGHKIVVGYSNRLTIVDSSDLNRELDWELLTSSFISKFAHTDTMISVVTRDGNVTVYDLAEAVPNQILQVPCYLVPSTDSAAPFIAEFSEDGTKLFVRTEERRIRIFDCSDGSQLGQPILTGTTLSVALSHNQSHCVVGGDSYARIQSIKWRQEQPYYVRHQNRLSHDDAVTFAAFGGQKLVATSGRDQIVRLWNVGEEKPPGGLFNERDIPLATLAHTDNVVGMLFHENGSRLMTLQRDGLIRIWHVPSFAPPGYTVQGNSGGTTLKSINANHWLIAGSSSLASKVVNASLRRLRDGVVVAETPLHSSTDKGFLLDAVMTADQSKLVSLHANPVRSDNTMVTTDATAGTIQVWEFPEGRPFGPSIPLHAEPRYVTLHPTKALAAVFLVNMEIVLVDLKDTSIIATLTLPTFPHDQRPADIESVLKPDDFRNGQLQFSSAGDYLLAWGIGKGFCVWDWQGKKQKFATDFADNWTIRHLAISVVGNQLAMACDDTNRVALLDFSDGKTLRELEFAAKIRSVEFSNNGQEILIACEDGRARIVDLIQENRKSIELIHNKKVLDACFSPDGSSIATLTSEMRVYLWNVRDRQWYLKPMPVPKGTTEIAYSPDSMYLFTMGIGDESRIIDLNSYDGSRHLDLNYVTMLGELLSAKSIGDGGIVNLTSSDWLQRWKAYQEKCLK